jgi:2-polyprenyl-3-methyl-5-hydroxy-6-metoxy-1,4-benzoquinol methylase
MRKIPSLKNVACYLKQRTSFVQKSRFFIEDINLRRRGLSKSRGERLYPDKLGEMTGIDPDHVRRYEWASQFCSGKQVLDYGCGVGYGSYLLSDVAANVVGYDVSEDALAWAYHYAAKRSNLHFTSVLPNGPFECITCFECIEHVDDPDEVLDWLSENINGYLFISTPEAQDEKWSAFHTREFGEEEFSSLLRRRFETVEITEQISFGCRVMLARCHHGEQEHVH